MVHSLRLFQGNYAIWGVAVCFVNHQNTRTIFLCFGEHIFFQSIAPVNFVPVMLDFSYYSVFFDGIIWCSSTWRRALPYFFLCTLHSTPLPIAPECRFSLLKGDTSVIIYKHNHITSSMALLLLFHCHLNPPNVIDRPFPGSPNTRTLLAP